MSSYGSEASAWNRRDPATAVVPAAAGRRELKYRIDLETRDSLLRTLRRRCVADEHAGCEGRYTSVSLYYDSPALSSYFEKVNGDPQRRKLRLRYYPDEAPEWCSAELKRRQGETIVKSRLRIPLAAVDELIARPSLVHPFLRELGPQDRRVLEEIWYTVEVLPMRPLVVVSYSRQPFRATDESGLRITFDTELRARDYDLDLARGWYGAFVLPPEICIMELKAERFLPSWAADLLQAHNCRRRTLSKYCLAVERCGLKGTTYA